MVAMIFPHASCPGAGPYPGLTETDQVLDVAGLGGTGLVDGA